MNTADLSALKPLAGIRVLEICNVAAGPFCALLLADLGADVIKLENPGAGDTLRAWPPHTGPENDRLSENFASLNRNKRSVTLDLKNPNDNARAKDLIANADVTQPLPSIQNSFTVRSQPMVKPDHVPTKVALMSQFRR